jgi:hypothetical protein
MKIGKFLLPLSFVFMIGIFSIVNPNAAHATASSCETSLDGSQVVPPVETDGTGSATLEFDDSTNELTWTVEYSGLTGPATVAHIHGPANTSATAGVQVNLADFSAGIESPIEGSTELTAEQASMLLDGQLYINIHTEANPAAEIRGQIACESSSEQGPTQTAIVAIGDQDFEIQYTIDGGSLRELTAEPGIQTLMADISSTSDGTLTLWLPTEVIDSEDDFSVFIDDEFGNFVVDELEPTDDARVLKIEFPMGAENIEVVGTSMAGAEAPEQEIMPVQIAGRTYDIPFKISGGTLQSVNADVASNTLLFTVSSNASGTLTLWLPTEVIDSEDDFSVFIDDEFGNFVVDELEPTDDARVLKIEFPMGAENIAVVGTSIVPEFGSLALIVASISIVGVILATTRFHKFGGLQA